MPPAITMTFASSLTDSPVAPTRHVTRLATVLPAPSFVVPILVANASVISVTRLPCVAHASAVRAIGM